MFLVKFDTKMSKMSICLSYKLKDIFFQKQVSTLSKGDFLTVSQKNYVSNLSNIFFITKINLEG